MSESLKVIENKKLLNVEILSDTYSMKLEFENGITLDLIANNEEEDNEQWMLFTPEKRVLTAGPFQNLTFGKEG